MNETAERRRKRLLFRCTHRGSKEADFLLGRFAARYLGGLSAEQLERLEALLEAPEPELYGWITGQKAVPAAYDNDVMRLLKDCTIGPPKP